MGINYQGRGIEEAGRLTVFVQETPIYDESVYPPILLGVSRSIVTGTDASGSTPITFTGTFSGDASQLTIAGAAISGSLEAITQTKAGYAQAKDFSGQPQTIAITLASAMSSSLYSVSVFGKESRAWTIEGQTTTGFTINTNSSVALNEDVFWSVAPFTQ
jgi:hypothetical protein